MSFNDLHFQRALQIVMDWYTERSLGHDCTEIEQSLKEELSYLTKAQCERIHEFHADLYLHGLVE